MLSDEERKEIWDKYPVVMWHNYPELFADIERAVLAKESQQVQDGADNSWVAYLEDNGDYIWHDCPADAIYKDGFKAGLKAMPAPKQEPVGYFVRGSFFYSKVEAEKSADYITSNYENCYPEPLYKHAAPPQAAAIPEIAKCAQDILDNDGAEGSKCFDALALSAARRKMRALLSAAPKPEGE